MRKLLFDTLNALYPGNVFLQGTFAPDEPYPETFITYFSDLSSDGADLDDETVLVNWTFTVNYYSTDTTTLRSASLEIRAALKNAGFIPSGVGHDLPTDSPTHVGWTMEFSAIQKFN